MNPADNNPQTVVQPIVPTIPTVPVVPPQNIVPVQTPKKNSLMLIAIILVVVALIVTIAYVIGMQFFGNKSVLPTSPQACTQEAKICPDGSSVGRTGPNCDFAACPTVAATPDPTANWILYPGIVFSYKYPADLYFDKTNNTLGADSILLYKDKNTADVSANCTKNKLGTMQQPCNRGVLGILIHKVTTNELSGYSNANNFVNKNLTGNISTITSQSGVAFQIGDQVEAANSTDTRAFTFIGNDLYQIDIQSYLENQQPSTADFTNLSSRILSTFKATAISSPVVSPTNSSSAMPAGY